MSNKKATRLEYLKKLNIVFDYIDNNLDKKLSIKELAEISNLSQFHFHRILTGILGETVGNYITRKRVETAAHLIRYTNLEIKEIAYSIGYETPSTLTKIFRQYYNISPTEYRKNKKFFIIRHEINNPKIQLNLPNIIEIPEKQVIYVRITGKYGNDNYIKVWNELWKLAKENELLTKETERIGISYDDPKITENDKCKYDACLTIKKAFKPQGKFGIKKIQGGKFAVFTYQGNYKNLGAVYDTIFGEWLINNQYELRNVPVIEKKANDISQTDTNKLITEIYLPIK